MAEREGHLVLDACVIHTIVLDAYFVACDATDVILGALAADGEAGHAAACADAAHMRALFGDRFYVCHAVIEAVN